MAYNSLQVPMIFGIPSNMQNYNTNSPHFNQTSSINLGCEQNYFQGIDMSMSPNISTCNTNSHNINNNTIHQPPSLISIRRDSGFAPSLDELSIGIMTSNQDRDEFKGVLHSLQTTAALQPTIMSSEIINDNNSPSFFLSTPTSPSTSPSTAAINNTEIASATPVVPSMSFGVEYPLASEQQQFLQIHQHQTPVNFSSPSSSCNPSNWNAPSNANFSTVQQSATFSMVTSEQQEQPQQQQQQQQQQQPTLLSPLQYHPRQSQIQRPRQRKPMLQIMTSAESEQPMFSNSLSPMFDSSFDNSNAAIPTATINSPSMSAANNIIRAGQQQQSHSQANYPWGFVSSPIESSFSSGSSTPLFASPSSSYAHSDMAASSCQSSRAASPSFAPSSLYENFLASERRIKSNDSPLVIRSRKSSTSSTSSLTSQRRASTLRESALPSSSPTNNVANGSSTPTSCISPSPTTPSSSSSGTHQCPKCGQRFAGPAVLVRHIESIHDKLLWNCVGCKSNLSRRDAVTRHINLSPMDSICRAVGTIGQIKTSNGAEVHYEISSYRAKPLDEVMNRMGKKISTTLRKEIDRSKAAALQQQHQLQQQQYHPYQSHQYMIQQEMRDIEMIDDVDDEITKKRRRPSLAVDDTTTERKKKM
ncbi:hypothetical protein FBU30_004865 [Linnemannia zychae]|nr:hypothetical protein FBU30_004865 [Linnemannia zychae]